MSIRFLLLLVSFQIHIYGPFSQEPVKTFTRFKDTAYCGRFRSDGQLLVAGCEDSVVRLFDVSGKVALRMFKGHTKYVSHVSLSKTVLVVFHFCLPLQVFISHISKDFSYLSVRCRSFTENCRKLPAFLSQSFKEDVTKIVVRCKICFSIIYVKV